MYNLKTGLNSYLVQWDLENSTNPEQGHNNPYQDLDSGFISRFIPTLTPVLSTLHF